MNIFIGNLDIRIEGYHLKEEFKNYGVVTSAAVIKDKATGVSRGFGFIEMPNDEEALKAIETLNGGKWEGNVITVRKAMNKK
jgi:RNA recognition motif-containing protein